MSENEMNEITPSQIDTHLHRVYSSGNIYCPLITNWVWTTRTCIKCKYWKENKCLVQCRNSAGGKAGEECEAY